MRIFLMAIISCVSIFGLSQVEVQAQGDVGPTEKAAGDSETYWAYEWNPAWDYQLGEYVVYNDVWYRADQWIAPGQNPESSSLWTEVSKPTQISEPIDPSTIPSEYWWDPTIAYPNAGTLVFWKPADKSTGFWFENAWYAAPGEEPGTTDGDAWLVTDDAPGGIAGDSAIYWAYEWNPALDYLINSYVVYNDVWYQAAQWVAPGQNPEEGYPWTQISKPSQISEPVDPSTVPSEDWWNPTIAYPNAGTKVFWKPADKNTGFWFENTYYAGPGEEPGTTNGDAWIVTSPPTISGSYN